MYQEICFNQEVIKPAFTFICRIIFEEYFIKAIEDFFPCFHSLISTFGARLLPKKILKGPSELNAENLGAQHMK